MNKVYKATRCLGRKLGMTKFFDGGKEIAVTLCRIGKNSLERVVKVDGDSAGFTGLFSYDEKPLRFNREIHVACGAADGSALSGGDFVAEILNDGLVLDAASFRTGMNVSVTGITRGRGFEGGMKVWGFAGLEASHGVSASHRALGSTGQRQDPGKVFKGKKMAKRLGGNQVKIKGLKIVDVNLDLGVVAVSGAIPGGSGTPIIFDGSFIPVVTGGASA